MKVYIAYKFKDTNPEELKKKLEELSKVIEESTGWKTFVFFRDVQNWQKSTMSVKEIVARAKEEIAKCDAILIEASEKANGVYFEAGYANALDKKVIVIRKKSTEAAFLESIANTVIEYDNLEDLGEKLKLISHS